MYYQQIADNENTREMISQFRGYNHNYRIDAGEWYDMENLSSDNYPVMTPREKRALLVETDNVRGVLVTNNNLTYLDGNTLYYGSAEYNLEKYFRTGSSTNDRGDIVYTYDTTEQTLVRFGAYIILFPAGVYVNVVDESMGSITEAYDAPTGITITYRICDSTGASLQNLLARNDAPEDPADGDYWLRTTNGAEGLYVWVGYLSTWEAVATCYIYIEIPGAKLAEQFATGDAVYLNSSIGDINNGSIIQSIADDHMIVIGMLPQVSMTEKTDSVRTVDLPGLCLRELLVSDIAVIFHPQAVLHVIDEIDTFPGICLHRDVVLAIASCCHAFVVLGRPAECLTDRCRRGAVINADIRSGLVDEVLVDNSK